MDCLEIEFPFCKSTIAICPAPSAFSHTVMNLSDSMVQAPNFTKLLLIDKGGLHNCDYDQEEEEEAAEQRRRRKEQGGKDGRVRSRWEKNQ
jgi:hypothetical protein